MNRSNNMNLLRRASLSRLGHIAKYLGLALATTATVIGLMAAGEESTPALNAYANGALRYSPNIAFGYGEKLHYDVGYKFITAGKAVMQIADKPETVSERPCYSIRFDVRTTSSFDNVFPVRDRYQTYVDVDGIFPWRFEQSVREGKYSRDFSAIIDQRANEARTTEGTFKVEPFVHDILSALYYIRTLNLRNAQKGQSLTLNNFYGKKVHELKVRFLGREQIEVEAGTFDCAIVEPLVVEGGLFKNEGRIIVYLTDDDRKLPVKVSTKVIIGSIDGELTSYSGTRGPVTARK